MTTRTPVHSQGTWARYGIATIVEVRLGCGQRLWLPWYVVDARSAVRFRPNPRPRPGLTARLGSLLGGISRTVRLVVGRVPVA